MQVPPPKRQKLGLQEKTTDSEFMDWIEQNNTFHPKLVEGTGVSGRGLFATENIGSGEMFGVFFVLLTHVSCEDVVVLCPFRILLLICGKADILLWRHSRIVYSVDTITHGHFRASLCKLCGMRCMIFCVDRCHS